jgi:hypothetical protein
MRFHSFIALTLCALFATVTSAPTPQVLSSSAGKDISNLKIQNAKALEKDTGVSRRKLLLYCRWETKDASQNNVASGNTVNVGRSNDRSVY